MIDIKNKLTSTLLITLLFLGLGIGTVAALPQVSNNSGDGFWNNAFSNEMTTNEYSQSGFWNLDIQSQAFWNLEITQDRFWNLDLTQEGFWNLDMSPDMFWNLDVQEASFWNLEGVNQEAFWNLDYENLDMSQEAFWNLYSEEAFWNLAFWNLDYEGLDMSQEAFWNLDMEQEAFWNLAFWNLFENEAFWNLEVQEEAFWNLAFWNLAFWNLDFQDMSFSDLGVSEDAFWNLAFWNLAFWNLAFWNLDIQQDSFWNLAFWNLGFWNLAFWNLDFQDQAFWNLAFWNLDIEQEVFWNLAFWNLAFWNLDISEDAFWNLAFWNLAFWNLAFWNLDIQQEPFWNVAFWNLAFWNLGVDQEVFWNLAFWNLAFWNLIDSNAFWNLPFWNLPFWNLPFWNLPFWNLPFWNLPFWNLPFWNLPFWNLPFWNLPFWNLPSQNPFWNLRDRGKGPVFRGGGMGMGLLMHMMRSFDPEVTWNVGSVFGSEGYSGDEYDTPVQVAVLDTGIDPSHPDLDDNVVWTYDATGTGFSDFNGHGTHVSGIIAAEKNGLGVAGIYPNAEIYSIKVIDGETGEGEWAWLEDALYKSVAGPDGEVGTADDADVINMSFGSGTEVPPEYVHTAIKFAYDHGVALVAAGGNAGDGDVSTDEINWPAAYDEVIAVSSTDQNQDLSEFSSTGNYIEVAAPGEYIYSTYLDDGYTFWGGTSMSTPHVSGFLALIIAMYGKLPVGSFSDTGYDTLRGILHQMTNDYGTPGWDAGYGYGIISL